MFQIDTAKELHRSQLDRCLLDTLRFLRDEWAKPDVGLVACALIDRGMTEYAAVRRLEDGKWLHAERQAYDIFQEKHGTPTSSAVVISTLSPCVKGTKWRVGPSCTSYLAENGVSKLYTGLINPGEISCEADYATAGLRITVSQDSVLQASCTALLKMFEYGKLLTTDLAQIKSLEMARVFGPLSAL